MCNKLSSLYVLIINYFLECKIKSNLLLDLALIALISCVYLRQSLRFFLHVIAYSYGLYNLIYFKSFCI